jgi:hypothetical protein
MPQSDPGSLREETYEAIVAYVLDLNGNGATEVLTRRGMQGLPVAR